MFDMSVIFRNNYIYFNNVCLPEVAVSPQKPEAQPILTGFVSEELVNLRELGDILALELTCANLELHLKLTHFLQFLHRDKHVNASCVCLSNWGKFCMFKKGSLLT